MNVCNQDYPTLLAEETNKQRNTPATLPYTQQTKQSQISPRNDIRKYVVLRPTIANQTGHNQTIYESIA